MLPELELDPVLVPDDEAVVEAGLEVEVAPELEAPPEPELALELAPDPEPARSAPFPLLQALTAAIERRKSAAVPAARARVIMNGVPG